MTKTPRRRIITCDVATIGQPDLATLDRLCRFSASLRGVGVQLRLTRASPELHALIALSGLNAALPHALNLTVNHRRQAKEREEPCGVEEEGDPGDAIV